MWIFTKETMRGPRAWVTAAMAVGFWGAWMFGYGWASVYASTSAHAWWLPLLFMIAIAAGLCVAPAGAVEVWSVLRGKCSEREVDTRRHSAGVATAWVIVIGVAIWAAWTFVPHHTGHWSGLEIFVAVVTYAGYMFARYTVGEIGRLRGKCDENEARVAQLERIIELLSERDSHHRGRDEY